jgi:hypothetical protein
MPTLQLRNSSWCVTLRDNIPYDDLSVLHKHDGARVGNSSWCVTLRDNTPYDNQREILQFNVL